MQPDRSNDVGAVEWYNKIGHMAHKSLEFKTKFSLIDWIDELDDDGVECESDDEWPFNINLVDLLSWWCSDDILVTKSILEIHWNKVQRMAC